MPARLTRWIGVISAALLGLAGCGKSGDVIQFVMQMDKIPFEEAVSKLAARRNIAKPE